MVIMEEAGGSFTDYAGERTVYGNCGIGTNGKVLTELLEVIAAAEGAKS